MTIDVTCPFCGNPCHAWREWLHCNYYGEPAECNDCGAFQNSYQGSHPVEDRPLDEQELFWGWARGESATCRRPCHWDLEGLDLLDPVTRSAFSEGLNESDGQCECPNCQAVRWAAQVEIVHADGALTTLDLVECFLTRLKFGDQVEALR